ncbi:GGDEF domain-containing protein [soil metagenome]
MQRAVRHSVALTIHRVTTLQPILSTLHSQSLGLAAFIMLSTLSGLTLFFYLTRKTYPGVGFWTAAQALLAGGFLLVILRANIPDWASVLAGNYLFLIGMALFYDGLQHFYGRPAALQINVTNHALGLVCLGLLAYFLYAEDNVYARVVCNNVFRVFIAARAFWLVTKGRRDGRSPPHTLLGIIFVFAATGIARITIALNSPQVVRFLEQDLNFRLSLLVDLIMILVISFGVLLLTHTRIADELDEARDKAERMSRTDQLTGLGNKFSFEAEARREIHRSKRYLHPVSLLVFDIDHFKLINDRFGHVTGDDVLKTLAKRVTGILRSSDVVYRWGGEEFVVMIPAPLDEAMRAAEKLRQKVELLEFKSAAPLTVSIGVAQLRHAETLETWMMRADDALYRAKAGGRNRVEAEAALEFVTEFDSSSRRDASLNAPDLSTPG